MKHFVLCCEELPERTLPCKSHLEERGVKATFVRAAHGRTFGLATTLEYDKGKRLPPGHVSLNVSSWFAWQHAWLSGEEWGLPDDSQYVFFEDDVCLPEDYQDQLGLLRDQLKHSIPDWDLVFLGVAETSPHCWNKVTERIGPPDSRLCRMNSPFGTHAIMLRRRALPVLIEHMRAAHKNLDQQLWERVLSKGLLKWCAVLPSIVTQRTFDYTGVSKPEWGPSTIDPSDEKDEPAPGLSSGEESPLVASGPSQGVESCESTVRLLEPVQVGKETIHPINPAPGLDSHTLTLIDPLPCLYRSDFSYEIAVMDGGRTVPLAKCGRFNDHCFARPGSRIVESDVPVRSCEECGHRREVSTEDERPRLPLPEGHFNASLAVWKGDLILATRDSWGHSKVSLWKLTNSRKDWLGEWKAEGIASLASKHPQASRLEDPRLFVYQGKMCASFNLPDGYPPTVVQVGYVVFSDDLKSIERTEVFPSPHDNLYEKNWVFTPLPDGEMAWIYAHKPEMIVISDDQTWKTPNNLPWSGGVIRGGATPIRVWSEKEERYEMWSFVHGCRKRLQGSVYTTGCVAYNPEPPFNVWRQTPIPLLWPDSKDGDIVVKRFVCWPGGAVEHMGNIFISLGIDDTYTRISVLPKHEVDEKLQSVPDLNAPPTLADTVMATGARK